MLNPTREQQAKLELSVFGPLTQDAESGHLPKHLKLKGNAQMKTGILSVPSGFEE